MFNDLRWVVIDICGIIDNHCVSYLSLKVKVSIVHCIINLERYGNENHQNYALFKDVMLTHDHTNYQIKHSPKEWCLSHKCLYSLDGSVSQVVGLPSNSYKPITNTAWVRARLCKLQKGALDSQPQVIKLTSCLPMVGGSLRVLRLLPSL